MTVCLNESVLTRPELLIPLLWEPSMDIAIECARVFGNFSQEQEVRDLLVAKRGQF